MSTSTIILTRRVQLFINMNDKESVQQSFKTLYNWQYACYRAANYIVTHLFLQEQVKQMIYLTEETRVKLADVAKDEGGILTTSRMNTTYRLLSKLFKGEVPMGMLTCLNTTLFNHFNNERASLMKGERSIRNYKRDIPIPFKGRNTTNWLHTADGRNFTFSLFGIPFRTYLGKDFTDKKILLDKMLQGTVKLCTSSLQLKDHKIYLLAAFAIEKEHHSLDETIIAEASLSIDYPIVVTIDKSRYNIGSKEEFLYRRLAIQSAQQRLQKATAYTRGGNGRKRKLKVLDRFAETERNYINTRVHVYSRRLIDICIKHHAATLILTDQQGKEQAAKADEFLLRNWSYSTLKEKIFYKAAKAGINIIIE